MELWSHRFLDPSVEDKDIVYLLLMSFDQFLELLAQIALLNVNAEFLNNQKMLIKNKTTAVSFECSNDQHQKAVKLDAFISYMNLDRPKVCKSIILTKGITRKAFLHNGIPNKHSEVEKVIKTVSNNKNLADKDKLLVHKRIPTFLLDRFKPYYKSNNLLSWKQFSGLFIDCGRLVIDETARYGQYVIFLLFLLILIY